MILLVSWKKQWCFLTLHNLAFHFFRVQELMSFWGSTVATREKVSQLQFMVAKRGYHISHGCLPHPRAQGLLFLRFRVSLYHLVVAEEYPESVNLQKTQMRWRLWLPPFIFLSLVAPSKLQTLTSNCWFESPLRSLTGIQPDLSKMELDSHCSFHPNLWSICASLFPSSLSKWHHHSSTF